MLTRCKKGFKQKKGKCVRNNPKKRVSSKRKSYNPFKMWGSYVGAIIFIMMPPILFLSLPLPETTSSLIFDFIGDLISAVIGFFIGWGIHSLIRRLRR